LAHSTEPGLELVPILTSGSVLEGRSVRLFIPKTEVLSIMILENYQDRAVLGFHPPSSK
jgi:hypothetical protein